MRRLIVAILFVASSAPAMTLPQYIDALEAIRAANATESRMKAQQLLGAQVDGFTADGALLHEVMASPAAAKAHLSATIAALRAATPATRAANADSRLLEELRREEAAEELARGGEVTLAPPASDEAMERTSGVLTKIGKWIERQLDKLANWWNRWWPHDRPRLKEVHTVRAKWIVTLIVIAIVLVVLVLAFEVVRRSRGAAPAEAVTSDAIASKADENPLSRGATEWERYAAQLAAAGRAREAIRAWYHAVLVTLFAAGILHFRKGRTNWEYIAALTPDLAWRADFVKLTRQFEIEWYGRERSTLYALEDVSERARNVLKAVEA